jgi:hypothetical protein
MPLMFKSWEEVDYVREKMRPAMEKKFLDKGFVVLAWGDAGWVRFFSKEPAVRPDDFKKMKFFAWGSEIEQQEIMKSLGYTPVPLETGDILPSIQTGMINAVPSTPYFALATQIYTTASNMLDMNWAPIVGALIITKKSLGRADAGRPGRRARGRRQGRRADARQGPAGGGRSGRRDEEARPQVNKPNAEQMKEWNTLADNLYPRIRGKMVPADTFDEVVGHLKAFRAGQR